MKRLLSFIFLALFATASLAQNIQLTQREAAFRAHKNGSNQTGIADITYTKVTFGTEVFDAGSYYDTTNSRWTPPAGPVLLSCTIFVTGTFTTGQSQVALYKNGAADAITANYSVTGGAVGGLIATVVDTANGTDYYECFVYADVSSGTSTVLGTATVSYFSGSTLN